MVKHEGCKHVSRAISEFWWGWLRGYVFTCYCLAQVQNKNNWTSFHKTWMKNAFQPRIDIYITGVGSSFHHWGAETPLKLVQIQIKECIQDQHCTIGCFYYFCRIFLGNNVSLLIKKTSGTARWITQWEQFDAHNNSNPDLADLNMCHLDKAWLNQRRLLGLAADMHSTEWHSSYNGSTQICYFSK